MGSFFKSGQVVPEIFEFNAQKRQFFGQDLEGTYMSEMSSKRRFLKGFFCNFLGINTLYKH